MPAGDVPAEDLPPAEFAFPGPLRDQLVAAILAGEKTTTTALVADYEHEGEPLPGHEEFWPSAEVRDALGDPGFTVHDGTLVVAQAFRLVADAG
ncbi:MAG: hypothetical protein ACLPKI_16910 [Streptosporangiaceae bacterium]